jgi:hypothetical protein
MQNIGYIIDRHTNEKIKVLWQKGRKMDKFSFVMNFKMRKSGQDGTHFTEEEDYLNIERDKLEMLKVGKTVQC